MQDLAMQDSAMQDLAMQDSATQDSAMQESAMRDPAMQDSAMQESPAFLPALPSFLLSVTGYELRYGITAEARTLWLSMPRGPPTSLQYSELLKALCWLLLDPAYRNIRSLKLPCTSCTIELL